MYTFFLFASLTCTLLAYLHYKSYKYMITLECILYLLAYVLKKLLKYGKIQMMIQMYLEIKVVKTRNKWEF